MAEETLAAKARRLTDFDEQADDWSAASADLDAISEEQFDPMMRGDRSIVAGRVGRDEPHTSRTRRDARSRDHTLSYRGRSSVP
jgi:hypothetical protein